MARRKAEVSIYGTGNVGEIRMPNGDRYAARRRWGKWSAGGKSDWNVRVLAKKLGGKK
jgi:hypothetical protein